MKLVPGVSPVPITLSVNILAGCSSLENSYTACIGSSYMSASLSFVPGKRTAEQLEKKCAWL